MAGSPGSRSCATRRDGIRWTWRWRQKATPRCRARRESRIAGGRHRVLARPRSWLFNRVGIAAFGDLSHAIGGVAQASLNDWVRFLGDAGIGIRADHRLGDTRFVTRIDLPIWFSRP